MGKKHNTVRGWRQNRDHQDRNGTTAFAYACLSPEARQLEEVVEKSKSISWEYCFLFTLTTLLLGKSNRFWFGSLKSSYQRQKNTLPLQSKRKILLHISRSKSITIITWVQASSTPNINFMVHPIQGNLQQTYIVGFFCPQHFWEANTQDSHVSYSSSSARWFVGKTRSVPLRKGRERKGKPLQTTASISTWSIQPG